MSKVDLKHEARLLPAAWTSKVVARAAGANIKVLRMDASSYPREVHQFAEALLVLEGQMNLEIEGRTVSVGAGEVFVVPGQHRAVLSDSPCQYPSVADRRETDVRGEHNVVPGRKQPSR